MKERRVKIIETNFSELEKKNQNQPHILSGCAGWSYSDWIGPFYPKTIKSEDYLAYYSKFFNFTEINSSFYHIPTPLTVNRWSTETPQNFKFSVKVWQKITHQHQFDELESEINSFFQAFSPLFSKIVGFLLQFPPKFNYSPPNMDKLKYIFSLLPKSHRYFLEVRDQTWYSEDLFQFIRSHPQINLVTSYLDNISPFFLPGQEHYYIRMIKNHDLVKFSRIQRDESAHFENLTVNVEELRHNPKVTDIFVIFNNHFRGFSPEDVVTFRKRVGLPYKEFSPQKRLDSFLF